MARLFSDNCGIFSKIAFDNNDVWYEIHEGNTCIMAGFREVCV